MSRLILLVTLSAFALGVAGTWAAPVPSDEGERVLARGKRFAARGQIDLFVAATAAWKLKADDVRLWEPAADLGRDLIKRAHLKGAKGERQDPQRTPSSYKDFATFVDRRKPSFKRMNETYIRPDPEKAMPPVFDDPEVIQAPGVVGPTGIDGCLILSQGDVQAGFGITDSVVFANGDVTTQNLLQDVVIVCDGDVTVPGRLIASAVVVARGNITAPSAATVVLIAGGKVEVKNKKALLEGDPNCILENQSKMLGLTFFELAQVGLKVKAADKTVAVDAVTARSAAEKAGLKPGDVVVEANGKKPTDAESLRRLLRDALAVGDATIKVQRGTDALTLKLVLPD
jgi:S1-C subfamily serine protease